LTAYWY